MRRSLGVLVAALLVLAGCTAGSEPAATSEPAAAESSAPAERSISLTSLDIDWPRAAETLDAAEPPAAPDGFDDALLARMAGVLTDWAQKSTIDDTVWRAEDPAGAIADTLPAPSATALREQTKDAVSPRLAVANVFGDEVTVIGEPRVTTAWKLSTEVDDAGKRYVVLALQTRAAYEVRLGEDGPVRVIGMLRVHGLSAYADTTDDFGVTGGWQEFGASDCALALDDDLVPAANLDKTEQDLKIFVGVGNGKDLSMPDLGAGEQVDAEYLQRCRNSTT